MEVCTLTDRKVLVWKWWLFSIRLIKSLSSSGLDSLMPRIRSLKEYRIQSETISFCIQWITVSTLLILWLSLSMEKTTINLNVLHSEYTLSKKAGSYMKMQILFINLSGSMWNALTNLSVRLQELTLCMIACFIKAGEGISQMISLIKTSFSLRHTHSR